MDVGRLALSLLPGSYAVARLDAADPWPAWALGAPGFVTLARTDDELSVICREEAVPAEVLAQRGWRVLKVHGPFPFGTVGVLASLAGPLAEAGVSILVVSTYDTDYVLIPEGQLGEAVAALATRHRVMPGDGQTTMASRVVESQVGMPGPARRVQPELLDLGAPRADQGFFSDFIGVIYAWYGKIAIPIRALWHDRLRGLLDVYLGVCYHGGELLRVKGSRSIHQWW